MYVCVFVGASVCMSFLVRVCVCNEGCKALVKTLSYHDHLSQNLLRKLYVIYTHIYKAIYIYIYIYSRVILK